MRYHQDSCVKQGFSGSADLTVWETFMSDQPCCYGNENFEISTQKSQ